MSGWERVEGAPRPLGATWIEQEQAYNFALYARHAMEVTLLVYKAQDVTTPMLEKRLDYLKHKSGRIWHCRIPIQTVPDGRYYAYRVNGPRGTFEGRRFDPEKILLDPYARGVFFPPAFQRGAASRPGSNAGRAPLAILPAHLAPFDWGDDRHPSHTHDTIIYEFHIKGFTKRSNSGVQLSRRGTYAGLIEKIPYLKDLGVTVVELLPIFQYDPQEGNYWGYMPLNFFTPHLGYSSGDRPEAVFDEFREMVKTLHQAEIEVMLDVVYNHTAESGERGPTYSFRGIDDSTYYLLDREGRYRDDSGTGNVLRCAHPAVRSLVLDSMRFWVKEMHIDGFRFDLASLFTRNQDGSINLEDPPIISEITADPDFAEVRLIAEAWDLGTYQLGRNFPGITWHQWNGQFRDDVRSFVKGDEDYVARIMQRLYGSDRLFPDTLLEAYRPYQSVNFVTAHDGFCLYDLVAYNEKHNEANGHQNRDGTEDNRSWNCGWEGDLNVPPEVVALRKQQIKNFCCLLMLANGTPMFVAGDEFMNTQKGNNNPYNQDNETSWLDWDLLKKQQDTYRFWKLMIAFRKAHPSIGRSRFWREDVKWYGVGGAVDMSYFSRSLAFCLHGASHGDQDLYVMLNAYWEPLTFTIQEGQPFEWRRVVDTSLASPQDILEPGTEQAITDVSYLVQPRSIVLMTKHSSRSRRRPA